MTLENLKKHVCEANHELVNQGLVTYTWGNVSGIDREKGIVAIKPSGISYNELTPADIVLVHLNDGTVITGDLKPSSDTPTHLELYRALPKIGGIAHTHSSYATSFAQAMKEIPCLGTTHADFFYGTIPVTRKMVKKEISEDYEENTGKTITELWQGKEGLVLEIPAVLVAQHGPFTWGADAKKSVEAAVVLEEVAKMALATSSINPNKYSIEQDLLDKHYLRKHGKTAYYGQ